MATQAPAQGGACTILMRYDDRRGVRRGLPVTETGAPLDSEGEAPAVRSGALDEPARGQEATSPERYARPGEIYLPAGTRLSLGRLFRLEQDLVKLPGIGQAAVDVL